MRATKYWKSEKGKQTRARYRQTEKGRIAEARHRLCFMQSAAGKAWRKRHKDTWRAKSAILIYDLEKPCTDCGEDDKLLLECDHIIPRFAGGTDDWDNLTVRCVTCHKLKTKEDFITYGAYVKRGIRCQ